MIIRTAKDKANPYALIHNGILNDERLTWQARGIAAYLLSKPDNWKINYKQLVNVAPNGRRAVLSAMKELEEAGYLQRTKYRLDRGKWATEVVLHELPQPSYRLPTVGAPTVGEPTVGNRAPKRSNTDQQSTDQPITERESTDTTTTTAAAAKNNGGGGGGGSSLPHEVKIVWTATFGEPSKDLADLIASDISKLGLTPYLVALREARDNVIAGQKIHLPRNYVKSLIKVEDRTRYQVNGDDGSMSDEALEAMGMTREDLYDSTSIDF